MSELHLIRHGQTDWNIQGRYQGQADMPLNPAGLAQARALAKAMEGQAFMAIYSSDLQRARQTAQILANRLGLVLRLDARLREIHQGEWQGLLVTDLALRYAAEMAARRKNPVAARAPGGESVAEVAARVYAAADEIARNHPLGRILVVSHGLALATLIARGRNIPLEQVYSLIPDNAQPTVVVWPSG
ncbi:MAG: histidine phosphatase family protein [Anaerolineaceae bacterium]|nr:histidine phosphatase family protein [Anaerolineaceae bacterium]